MTPKMRHLSAGQAADVLGVSRQTVARWCEQGTLAAHRTAGGPRRRGQWRILPSAVAELKTKSTKR